ncbi:fimbrial protein [Klebsiella aerogenes]|uniref:fimbrial protein n=1 Tax=Klebsiella aerogenes TaxID=548 RepID=UPI001F31F20E|nr:fimbrial protein [Klebsiella aerogenes]
MKYLTLTACAIVLGLSAHAFAATQHNDAPIKLSGTLIKYPPCTFNGGNDIEVPFGDNIMIKYIDGVSYRKVPVPYGLVCDTSDYSYSSKLKLTLIGEEAPFGSGLLKTNKTALGIQFMTDSGNLPMNTDLNFEYSSGAPALYAVLAQDSANTLTGGEFSATATIMVDYQ